MQTAPLEVTVAMIRETTQCVGGEFVVYVYTLNGDTIPTSPVVTHAEIGMDIHGWCVMKSPATVAGRTSLYRTR